MRDLSEVGYPEREPNIAELENKHNHHHHHHHQYNTNTDYNSNINTDTDTDNNYNILFEDALLSSTSTPTPPVPPTRIHHHARHLSSHNTLDYCTDPTEFDILNLHSYDAYDWFLFIFTVILMNACFCSCGCIGYRITFTSGSQAAALIRQITSPHLVTMHTPHQSEIALSSGLRHLSTIDAGGDPHGDEENDFAECRDMEMDIDADMEYQEVATPSKQHSTTVLCQLPSYGQRPHWSIHSKHSVLHNLHNINCNEQKDAFHPDDITININGINTNGNNERNERGDGRDREKRRHSLSALSINSYCYRQYYSGRGNTTHHGPFLSQHGPLSQHGTMHTQCSQLTSRYDTCHTSRYSGSMGNQLPLQSTRRTQSHCSQQSVADMETTRNEASPGSTDSSRTHLTWIKSDNNASSQSVSESLDDNAPPIRERGGDRRLHEVSTPPIRNAENLRMNTMRRTSRSNLSKLERIDESFERQSLSNASSSML